MVTGIESFKEWFKGNESQYAIIGGTACDILMTEEGLDFRATKDIDLVLIIEAVDAAFGRKFWDYVKQAGYEHRNKSSGMPQFYRFSHPTSNRYPAMIELFTRKLDAIQLPDDAVLTPLPMDEDIHAEGPAFFCWIPKLFGKRVISTRMCRSKDLYSLSVNRQKSKNRTLFSTTAEFWWRRRFTDLTVRL